VATPTLADPTRAPSGKHTVKLLSQQVYQLPAAMPGWDVVKARHARRQLEHLRLSAPGFTDDVILAQLVKSPADYEQLNPHMVHGAFHGGDRGIAQTGPLRPVPGWASHRMPIAGLYQTGATTHPGGSITGAPGRNAAIVLLHDLGHDPAEVMSTLPAPTPQRNRPRWHHAAPRVPATITIASGPTGVSIGVPALLVRNVRRRHAPYRLPVSRLGGYGATTPKRARRGRRP